jgi:rhodanese-related sulfurtransferase
VHAVSRWSLDTAGKQQIKGGLPVKKIITTLFSVVAVFCAGTSLALDNITPTEAYYLATSNPNAFIIDVRTAAEWEWVGHPGQNRLGQGSELEGKVIHIPYLIDHKGSRIVNPSFLTDVKEIFSNGTNVELILMCRSGQRSLDAGKLLEGEGYRALNMLTGFEGGTDSRGYRATTNGWKNMNLPYTFGRTAIYMD